MNTDPIIAAIPSMVLVCIILFLGSYALANRRLWQVGAVIKSTQALLLRARWYRC